MKRAAQNTILYIASIVIALALLLAILHYGAELHPTITQKVTETSWSEAIQQEFAKNLTAPLTGLLSQIFLILVFSRICAIILKKLGQPQVVGEMIAGILLGQSAFAAIWPQAYETIFPAASMPRLYFLSQIGLIFFMFVVGLDLKIAELKKRASAALLISHVSIVFPFLLGVALALHLYGEYESTNVAFTSFALFMGIAMSITAFPVLARIIQEKKLTNSPLGTMALTCAAVDDVTAWCILATIIGIVKAGTMSAAIGVLAATLLYILIMIKLVRPWIATILKSKVDDDGNLTRGPLALVFCIVLGSALIAEIIGIHALFGAFLAGAIMPQDVSLRSSLIGKIEDLSAVVLLPIFFAYTGIRMQTGLLDTWQAWFSCGVIIVLAIIGKLAGSALAARWSGMKWRDSLALGALMNTRGLMELVVLNIGYDLGILSPEIFAMMVIMAVLTTVMTGPLLSVFLKKRST